MPRKDGSPTAAERRDADRRQGNERFIAAGNDLSTFDTDTLIEVRAELTNPAAVSLVDAEIASRYAEEVAP